jgi:serine phosphatase RsbU (regulator of sigma subunit)
MGILFELRDRVRAQGEPPAMAHGWTMTRSLRSAGDAAFRGDFTLAHRDGRLVQALLVDVSGHGVDVAARSVQVAGAFGGLIGVVEPEQTLSACNSYVVRQDWDHDYATAVHAVVDQATGGLAVRCAGHPAPRVRRADGRWESLDARGPVLGLSPAARFAATSTTLAEGDALVLVSDGCLDEASPDPWHAVTATVERWLGSGSMAEAQVLDANTASGDDQTLLLIARPGDSRG